MKKKDVGLNCMMNYAVAVMVNGKPQSVTHTDIVHSDSFPVSLEFMWKCADKHLDNLKKNHARHGYMNPKDILTVSPVGATQLELIT